MIRERSILSCKLNAVSSSGATYRYILAAIIAASVTARLASAVFQGDAIQTMPGVYDQYSYDALARRVLSGNGFTFAENWWPATKAGEPTAHWSYLYTLYLAAVYQVFGHHPLAARVLQAVVAGVLHPWLTWRLGSRLFGQKAGLAAAAIAAAYLYFIFYAGALMTETFYILAILWAFDLALRTKDRSVNPPLRLWITLGLALGIAVLLRQSFLLTVPFIFGWLVWQFELRKPQRTAMKPRLAGVLIASVVLVAVLLPWTVRNYRAFGHFVLLNTNAGYVMFWSNHPVHGTRFVPIFPDYARSYGELIPPGLLGLDEASMDRALFVAGIRSVAADPGRFLLLSISRVREYFKFWPSSESSSASNIVRVFSFGVLLPFMALGIGVSVRNLALRGFKPMPDGPRSNSPHAPGVVLILTFAAVYSLIHIFSWTLIRYRLPVDAVLLVFAPTGAACVYEAIRRLRPGRVRLNSRRTSSADAGIHKALLPETEQP